jgi:hypothetical protein
MEQCRILKLVLQMAECFTASVCVYLIERLAVIFLLTRLFVLLRTLFCGVVSVCTQFICRHETSCSAVKTTP